MPKKAEPSVPTAPNPGACPECGELHDDLGPLEELLEPLYDELAKAGCPPACLPSPYALVHRLLVMVDRDALGEWIRTYSALMRADVATTWKS